MVALFFEKRDKAIAAVCRAVLVGDAFLDGRDQQAVDERFVRAAVVEERFDAALRLVDGRNLVPLGWDDVEMLFDVLAIGLEGIVFRKEMRIHAAFCDATEIRCQFFFRRGTVAAVFLADEWQLVDAVLVSGAVLVGKFLRGELVLAVQEQRDGCQRVAARLVFENPFDSDMRDGVFELQRLLDFSLGDGLVRQDGLDERLDKDGFACAVLEQQDAVIAVKLERRVDIAFFAAVINDVREADPADRWHGNHPPLLCGRGCT